MKNLVLALIALLIVLTSCEEIDFPKDGVTPSIWNATGPIMIKDHVKRLVFNSNYTVDMYHQGDNLKYVKDWSASYYTRTDSVTWVIITRLDNNQEFTLRRHANLMLVPIDDITYKFIRWEK